MEVVYGNARVKEAIARIDAKTVEELDWNRATNLQNQYKQMARYEAILADDPKNFQALQGLDRVFRELNASSNQHSATVNTGAAKPIELTPEQQEQAKAAAKAVTKPTLVKETA